jgi:hypothetical protein
MAKLREIHGLLWRAYKAKLELGYTGIYEALIQSVIADTVSHHNTKKIYFELLKSMDVIRRVVENESLTNDWTVIDPSDFHYQTTSERMILNLEKQAAEKRLVESKQPEKRTVE